VRIALITPYYQLSTVGNAVTVRRIGRELQKQGCTVAVFSLEGGGAEALVRQIRLFSPDMVHAFHAVRCGEAARLAALENRVPYIITLTGTDMYQPAGEAAADKRSSSLCEAAALVFFSEAVKNSFLRTQPHLAVPTAVIPQGVYLPESPGIEPPDATGLTFLLPAGIRAVKNILFPVAPLAELLRRYPQTKLILAGAVIEPAYAVKLQAVVAANPFTRWLGEISQEMMPELYASAHVVLNSSLSEGGMANSLLEGMAYGRALLAADIEGNRSLVRSGENGFLYSDAADFSRKAETLSRDRELRRRMAAAGREYVSRHCSPALEAGRYLELYAACRR
jgi:glycosyltransferase involved in cell wall biosynthesis